MRRPLACFGFAFLLACAVVVRQAYAALLWICLAAVAVAVGLGFLLWAWRKAPPKGRPAAQYMLVVLCALVAAIAVRVGYDTWVLTPHLALAGKEYTAVMRVTDAQPGYGEDRVNANVQLLELQGNSVPGGPVTVRLQEVPSVEVGWLLRADLRLEEIPAHLRLSRYAQGYVLQAELAGEPEVLGVSDTWLTRMRRWQYAASERIQSYLSVRLGQVAAAMSVGDRRTLSFEVKNAYRAAGLSHLLVVSGMHLSVLCGGIVTWLQRTASFHRRRLLALLGMALTVLFMALCGLSPSVVRSGLCWLCVFGAEFFSRPGDVYTSLGLAILIMVGTAPYAAANVGLLLSFAATLGTLLGGRAQKSLGRAMRRFWHRHLPSAKFRRLMRGLYRLVEWVLANAVLALCVTAATLPVLCAAGLGISVFSLPANLLAVPFLPVVVVCGALMALPQKLLLFGLLGRVAALAVSAVLTFYERITDFCAGFPLSVWATGGLFAFWVIVVVYCICWLGMCLHVGRRKVWVACAGILLVSVVLHGALQANTVRVMVCGSSGTPSLVVAQNSKAVVLYAGRNHIDDIRTALHEADVKHCTLLVDMRRSISSEEGWRRLQPQQIAVAENLIGAREYHPLKDVHLTLVHQGEGSVACVDIGGYRLGLLNGTFDFSAYAPLDVLLPGGGTAQHAAYKRLLYSTRRPAWADEASECMQVVDGSMLWIRSGKSVLEQEVMADGLANG